MADGLSRVQQIGQALGGFGAGIQGNLPQFQAAQNQRRQLEAQETERQRVAQLARQEQIGKFTAGAARQALELIEAGDFDQARMLGESVITQFSQLGLDPSGAQRISALVRAAGNGSDEAKKLAISELEIQVRLGESFGFIESPTKPAAATNLGKARRDLERGDITQSQYDALEASILAVDESPADQRERKIDQYMTNFGLSENEAIVAVDSIMTVDATGNATLFNPITGESTMLTSAYRDEDGGGITPPETPAKAEIEDLAIDVAAGTGSWAAMLALYNKTFGQLPFLPIAKGPEQSAQELRFLERDAIRALASSNRPPVIEQERIMAVIPDALAWFENPQVAQLQTTNFVDLMMQQYADDLRFSSDPSNPKEVRNTSRERANNIESIIRRVLVPDAANAMFNTTNRMIGSGSRIQEMSDTELLSLDISDLSDDELDLYEQRLRGL